MKRSGRDEDTNCLMLLSKVGETNPSTQLKGFRCKTCNRQFPSFQALGGHRASHKKPRLMGADLSAAHLPMKLKHKMHPCPICGLQFGIGQALGGHMRKHRSSLINRALLTRTRALPNSTKTFGFCLDLNLTPLENDLDLNLRTPVSLIV